MSRSNGIDANRRKQFAEWKPNDDLIDLRLVFLGVRAIRDALGSIINQPRTNGVALDTLNEWDGMFGWMQDDIARKARSLNPPDKQSAEARAEIILQQSIDCGLDDPKTILSTIEALQVIQIAKDPE